MAKRPGWDCLWLGVASPEAPTLALGLLAGPAFQLLQSGRTGPVWMLRPRKQTAADASSGLPGGTPSRKSTLRTAPTTTPGLFGPDPSPRPLLTWGQVCAEGTVDEGEVQHNGRAGVLGLGKQVALTGFLQVLREHLDTWEGDASVQAVLLCHL